MRVSWSFRAADSVGAVALLGLAAIALVTIALAPAGAGAQSSDTSKTASRVTISRDGIRIESSGGTIEESAEPEKLGDKVTIDVDTDRDGKYGPGRGEIVSFFRDVNVPPGRTVHGEVVSLFGNVRVEGEVIGDVVAVFGSIQLGDSARVGGDVVAIGGVDASPTAAVQGELVSIPFFGLPGFSAWTLAFGLLLLTGLGVLFGCLAAIISPGRLVRAAETVSRRTLMSFLLGVLSLPILLVLSVLLCVTVVGIVMAALLVALYPLFVFLGFATTATLLGSRLRNAPLETQPIWISTAVGIVFNGVFVVVGGMLLAVTDSHGAIHAVGLGLLLVGLLLHTLLSTLGSGALLLSGLGAKDTRNAAASAVGQVSQPAAPA